MVREISIVMEKIIMCLQIIKLENEKRIMSSSASILVYVFIQNKDLRLQASGGKNAAVASSISMRHVSIPPPSGSNPGRHVYLAVSPMELLVISSWRPFPGISGVEQTTSEEDSNYADMCTTSTT